MPTILVVDDDADIRFYVSFALSNAGYEVREAINGQDALRLLDEWKPDGILLDLNMPVMDGWTFCSERNRRSELADIPITIMSAVQSPLPRDAACTPLNVLEKPFSLDALLRTVESLARD